MSRTDTGASAIVRARMVQQGLQTSAWQTPSEVVQWLGAVQAQDYPLACWAVGQRMREATQDTVAAAVAHGHIVRTHVLRPTWHFVAPRDLRWMLALTGPRIRQRMRPYDRSGGLDADTVRRTVKAIGALVRRGEHLSRDRIMASLRTRFALTPWALGHVLMYAEIDGVVCSGTPVRGRQTYAAFDARIPEAVVFRGDEALAELARRYFRGRGPATELDFRWWSGLGAAESRRAIAALGSVLVARRCEGLDCHEMADHPRASSAAPRSHLLHPFDELVVAYSESRHLIDPRGAVRHRKPGGLLSRLVVVDGQVAGRWRRETIADALSFECELPRRPSRAVREAIDDAVARHASFLGRSARQVRFTTPG